MTTTNIPYLTLTTQNSLNAALNGLQHQQSMINTLSDYRGFQAQQNLNYPLSNTQEWYIYTGENTNALNGVGLSGLLPMEYQQPQPLSDKKEIDFFAITREISGG